jgi:hypothetical protein
MSALAIGGAATTAATAYLAAATATAIAVTLVAFEARHPPQDAHARSIPGTPEREPLTGPYE